MEKGFFKCKLYIFLFLAHLAFAIIYMERLNLSIALVAMVRWSNQTNITIVDETDSNLVGKFQWDQAHQGMLLSAFFYGYVPLQLPAGVLVDKYGGKLISGLGLLLSSLFTVLTPLAAMSSFSFVMVARVCVGLSQGVIYPALLAMLRNWSSHDGKNQAVALATSGTETGAILAFSLGGILCNSTFLDGWPSVFYVFGGMGIVWFIAWMAIVTETVQQYTLVPEDEESLTLKQPPQKQPLHVEVPWLKILSSTPLWAAAIGTFCHNWIWYFMITELPLYYKQVLNMLVMEGGLFSALPIIAAFLTHTVSGFLSDYLQRQWWTVKTTRRFMSLLGFSPTALLLVAVSYTKPGENVQAVVYMTLCAGVLRFNRVTFLSNIIDLSPTFTGVLMGISNTVSNFAGVGAPLVTGFFTNHDPSPENYRIVFFINAAMCVFGGVFFSAFVSGDVQEWDPAGGTYNE